MPVHGIKAQLDVIPERTVWYGMLTQLKFSFSQNIQHFEKHATSRTLINILLQHL